MSEPEVGNTNAKNKDILDERDEGLFVRLLMLDELKISKQESSDNIVKTFSYQDLKPAKLQTLKTKKQTSKPAVTSTNKCVRCKANVYSAEMIITRVGPVHKGCYTCFTCHRYLTPANVVQVDELYCTNCYKLKMMSRMSTPTICSTTSIMADTEGRDRCPRCMGKVFKAEQVLTSNAVYHKSCFRCAEVECGKHLDSSNYCDSEQGMIFCPGCYKKISSSSSVSSRDQLDQIDGRGHSENELNSRKPGVKCPACEKPVYAVGRLFIGSFQWHRACLVCCNCSRPLDASTMFELDGGERVSCRKCYKLFV